MIWDVTLRPGSPEWQEPFLNLDKQQENCSVKWVNISIS